MYYFYVLENESRELYFGYTNNLRRRLLRHKRGDVKQPKGKVMN